MEAYAKNLEESLAEKTECLENLEAALTSWLMTIMVLFIELLTAGEIPKQLIEQINDGKTIPIQKYQAAILVVYDANYK